jgi:hypothetical protein
MAATIDKISEEADNFPTTEVAYEDMLPLSYRVDGRFSEGAIDCLGVVIEVFKRAGLRLPDPKRDGGATFRFTELFEVAVEPYDLFDVISYQRAMMHVAVIVRSGYALTATESSGVSLRSIKAFKRVDDAEYWRVRTDRRP